MSSIIQVKLSGRRVYRFFRPSGPARDQWLILGQKTGFTSVLYKRDRLHNQVSGFSTPNDKTDETGSQENSCGLCAAMHCEMRRNDCIFIMAGRRQLHLSGMLNPTNQTSSINIQNRVRPKIYGDGSGLPAAAHWHAVSVMRAISPFVIFAVFDVQVLKCCR